jgi:FdhD protein
MKYLNREVGIVKIDVSTRKTQESVDCVAEERPFHIFLGKSYYVTLLCSPSNLRELAVGHMLTEGLAKSVAEIEDVSVREGGVCRVKMRKEIDVQKRLRFSASHFRVIPSACGGASSHHFFERSQKVKSDMTVGAETILDCMRRLNSDAKVFRKTGGVHAAAMYDSKGMKLAFAEDVGRHNAVDKVIGITALQKRDLSACFLALSGRLTSEIVSKAARVGIPMLASLAAAVDSGIAVGQRSGVTLVGFVRGNRMNVYSLPRRILV